VALVVIAGGCQSSGGGDILPLAPGITFRIENATSSTASIAIQVLDAFGNVTEANTPRIVDIPVVTVSPDGVSFGTLNPIGAAAALLNPSDAIDPAVSGLIGTDADVRVTGFSISEGRLSCDALVRVTATLEGISQQVVLSGAGTGTAGFDSGSTGEDGVRYLVSGSDYTCGEAVVIRIDDDGTGTASTATGVPSGRLAVVPTGSVSPFKAIVPPSGGEGAEESNTVTFQVRNENSVIGTATILVGSGEDVQTFVVSVPPNSTSTGDFACATQFQVTASFPNPETPDDRSTEALVILSGDGTGSLGFDENSVSREGERYLVLVR
jgi:hypothetical protein